MALQRKITDKQFQKEFDKRIKEHRVMVKSFILFGYRFLIVKT